MINNADNSSKTPALATASGTASVFSKSDCLNHYTWGDGCHGWTFIDSEALSIKQELMPPDTTEQAHFHQYATQFFFILKGRAVFTLNGETITLREQQGIEIKPGQKHSIANNQSLDLEFILYSYPPVKGDRVNI